VTAKTGGTLFGTTSFIPFGKEGGIGYDVMANTIQQKKNFLHSTRQRIVKTYHPTAKKIIAFNQAMHCTKPKRHCLPY
jgi:hypothetical protein